MLGTGKVQRVSSGSGLALMDTWGLWLILRLFSSVALKQYTLSNVYVHKDLGGGHPGWAGSMGVLPVSYLTSTQAELKQVSWQREGERRG